MTRSRTDARVGKTRQALRTALLDLIATERFEEISAAAIVKRAGVGYATFFRHYPDPHALLIAIAEDMIEELLAEVAPPVLAGDRTKAANALTHFVAERRAVCHALLLGAGDAVRHEIIARAVAAARLVETPSHGLPPDLAITHGVSATLTILTWWLEHPEVEDAIPSILDRLVFAPLAKSSVPMIGAMPDGP